MKRPLVLVAGAVAAGLVIWGVGASAHSGSALSRFIGAHSASIGSEASGERNEDATEPADTPEPAENPEPQPTENPETETEANDADDQAEEADNEVETEGAAETEAVKTTSTSGSQEHESGGGDEGSGNEKD